MRVFIFFCLSVLVFSSSSNGFAQTKEAQPASELGWVQVPSDVTHALALVNWASPRVAFVGWWDGIDVNPPWTFRSEDSGKTWTSLPAAPWGYLHFWTENRGIATRNTFWPNCFHTYDGGITWDTIPFAAYSFPDEKLGKVEFTRPNEGYAVSGGDRIVHTLDSGRSWASSKELGQDFGRIAFADSLHGFAVGRRQYYQLDSPAVAGFARTTDGGKNWELINTHLQNAFYDVAVPSRDTLVVTASNRQIFRSESGGSSWKQVYQGEYLNNIDMPSKRRGFVTGDKGTILMTEDGGQNWNRQNTSVSATLSGIKFLDTTHGLAVGEQGVILRTTNAGTSWVKVYPPEGELVTTLSQTSQELRVKCTLAKQGNLHLEFYSIEGRPMGKIDSRGMLPPGSYEYGQRTASWPSGAYIYRVTSEGGTSGLAVSTGTFTVIR